MVVIEIGISTASLYPMETEHALDLLCSLGVTVAELFLNAPCEVEPSYLQKLRSVADEHGVRICAVHPYSSGFEPFMFFSDYRRRFEDMMQMYKVYYNAANILGAQVVALHGDREGGPLPDVEYFERFGELSRGAKQFGVTLAQENVSRCKSRSPKFIRAMRQYLGDDARFVLDLKQAVRASVAPMEMLDAMGLNIAHLHLSDSAGKQADCLPPGEGTFDFTALAQQLQKQGYAGCGVIELYRDNYSEPQQLVHGCAHLKQVFQKVWR